MPNMSDRPPPPPERKATQPPPDRPTPAEPPPESPPEPNQDSPDKELERDRAAQDAARRASKEATNEKKEENANEKDKEAKEHEGAESAALVSQRPAEIGRGDFRAPPVKADQALQTPSDSEEQVSRQPKSVSEVPVKADQTLQTPSDSAEQVSRQPKSVSEVPDNVSRQPDNADRALETPGNSAEHPEPVDPASEQIIPKFRMGPGGPVLISDPKGAVAKAQTEVDKLLLEVGTGVVVDRALPALLETLPPPLVPGSGKSWGDMTVLDWSKRQSLDPTVKSVAIAVDAVHKVAPAVRQAFKEEGGGLHGTIAGVATAIDAVLPAATTGGDLGRAREKAQRGDYAGAAREIGHAAVDGTMTVMAVLGTAKVAGKFTAAVERAPVSGEIQHNQPLQPPDHHRLEIRPSPRDGPLLGTRERPGLNVTQPPDKKGPARKPADSTAPKEMRVFDRSPTSEGREDVRPADDRPGGPEHAEHRTDSAERAGMFPRRGPYEILASDGKGGVFSDAKMTEVLVRDHPNLPALLRTLERSSVKMTPDVTLSTNAEIKFVRIVGPDGTSVTRALLRYNPDKAVLQAVWHEFNHLQDFVAGRIPPSYTIDATNAPQFVKLTGETAEELVQIGQTQGGLKTPLEAGMQEIRKDVAEMRTHLKDLEELPAGRRNGLPFAEESTRSATYYYGRLKSVLNEGFEWKGQALSNTERVELIKYAEEFVKEKFPELPGTYRSLIHDRDFWAPLKESLKR